MQISIDCNTLENALILLQTAEFLTPEIEARRKLIVGKLKTLLDSRFAVISAENFKPFEFQNK